MRNVWIQTDYAFATWVGDLTEARARPRELLDAVIAILTAGARHRVFLPVSLPVLGFERARGGDPAELVAAQWTEHRVIDAFSFTGAAMAPGAPGSSTVEAEMAWFDRSDEIQVARTADLGAVLRELEPVPGSIGDGFTVPFPPVQIRGRRLRYAGEPPVPSAEDTRRPTEIRIALHSDIWFPYVLGSAHPLADQERYFDNRALAHLHTPRLNDFLYAAAAAIERAGGTWQVDLEETGADARRWVDERGIKLVGEPPTMFPIEAFDTEWF